MRHAKLVFSVRELTELMQRALTRLVEMSAHLRFVLLPQRVELALVAIDVIVVRGLGHVAAHLAGRRV